jgi:hypothetical protein
MLPNHETPVLAPARRPLRRLGAGAAGGRAGNQGDGLLRLLPLVRLRDARLLPGAGIGDPGSLFCAGCCGFPGPGSEGSALARRRDTDLRFGF